MSFSTPLSTSWSPPSLAFTALKYVSSETKKELRTLCSKGRETREKRTPKQTDYTDKHEPEVWGNDGEVDDLSGYVYSPGIVREKMKRGPMRKSSDHNAPIT